MEKTSWSGFQPVEFAITHGCTEGVELLLKAGCSFDSRRGFYSFNTNNIFAFAVEMLAVSVSRFATLKLQGYYFEAVEIIIKNLALRQGDAVPSMIDAQIADLILRFDFRKWSNLDLW